MAFALDEYRSRGNILVRKAFWTDASCSKSKSGIAVVWKTNPSCLFSAWEIRGYRVLHSLDSTNAELLAILQALEIAAEHIIKSYDTPFVVAIFSDSARALAEIRGSSRNGIGISNPLIQQINQQSWILSSRGIETHLHCSPGHVGIPGNDLADRVAKRAAKG
ncbi:hypothetical protein PRK78_003548 [Emydomyces testavorans]|uniref:ribonuclease H n=1 Tax=Emydomyces testavorans TaxID=2070801 RepID=A0AAF0DG85_9EURO|nr:hypothetical protein PRK78_003548 [Emydomyces testavorans]